MPRELRIALFLVVLVAVLVGTITYVHRRTSSTLNLSPAARRGLLAGLIGSAVAMLVARSFGAEIGPTATRWLGGLGATGVIGIFISTVLVGVVDLVAFLGRRARRAPRLGVVGAPGGDDAFEDDTFEGDAFEDEASEPAPDERSDRGSPDPGSPDRAVSQPAVSQPAVSQPAVSQRPVSQRAEPEDAVSEPAEGADAPTDEASPALGRRALLRRSATGVALSVGFGSSLYGAVFGRHDYELNEIPVPIPGLRPALDGYRIAQISDIHFGSFVGDPELRAAVDLVRRARPDLIVMTGDLLDHDAAYAPWLGRLVRAFDELGARDGVAMIPGNHDYYAGVDQVLGVCRQAGARVLRNDGAVLQGGLALLGVDDVWARRNGYGGGPDLEAALATVPRDLPRVLLCHNPSFFEDARGQVALQLSGHTHGGQVNLGVRPADFVLPYVHGLYEEHGSRLYVNRGFGTAGPPSRVGAPPEINVTVLVSA